MIWLENHELWSNVYAEGSNSEVVTSLVAFAQASLKACKSLDCKPSLIVTNDWFTGLIPAVAKKAEHKSFF